MARDASLLELLTAYRRLAVTSVACELGLFTRLAEGPTDAAELAAALGADEAVLAAMAEACVGLGLLRAEDGRFANRPAADIHLVKGRPRYLGHLLHLFDAEAPQWRGLAELVRTGRPPEKATGGEVGPRRFTLAMHALGVMGEAEALAAVAPLEGCRDLVDVGCGSGVYSIALCRRFPLLRATLLDRAEVLATTRELVTDSGVGDRITLRSADITVESYGSGRDAVLLSDVLYLDEGACLGMLRSAFGALAPGGRLVVRGYWSDPDGAHPAWGALFDLARMLWDAGRVPITHTRLRGWLERTGFCAVELHPLTERSSLALAIRP